MSDIAVRNAIQKLGNEIPECEWKYDATIPAIVAYKDGELMKTMVTQELIEDLKAVCGLDVEEELANILKTEIEFELENSND